MSWILQLLGLEKAVPPPPSVIPPPADPPPSGVARQASTLIIDLAIDPTPHLAALRSANVGTIFGYLSSINPTGAKCWTPQRVRAVADSGMRVGLVHEGWGGVGGKGVSSLDGLRDGAYCRTRATELGAPKGAGVYFACDTDFVPSQIISLVLPYFKQIRSAFADGYYRVGVYGSGAVCSAVKGATFADLIWLAQSKGWSGYTTWLPKADMVQGRVTKLAGLDVDTDTAQGDIGDYVPEWSVG
jgi:hypothetical protein